MKKKQIFSFFCSCFKAGMHLPTRTAYDFCISAAYSDIAKTKMKTALKKNTRQLKTTGKVRSSQKKIERLCTNHADGARKFSVVRKKGGHFLPRDLRWTSSIENQKKSSIETKISSIPEQANKKRIQRADMRDIKNSALTWVWTKKKFVRALPKAQRKQRGGNPFNPLEPVGWGGWAVPFEDCSECAGRTHSPPPDIVTRRHQHL